ncbi:GerMN domain-containing protein [Candidatus Uhrbacteria bacterium]|nr:GerMN domain-containing protein [Candidatus Uhrbacteria bacterium]
MPKAKTTKQPDNSPFDRSGAGIRAALLFTVVAFLTIALVVVWKQLPKEGESKPKPPIVSNQEKLDCKAKGGRWVECASPCAPGEICAQVCVAKCLMPEVATSTPLQVEVPEPEPATPVRERPEGMSCDDRNFICVDPVFAESTLTSPFIVQGTGIAFENTINWRLLDGNGVELEKGFVTADAPDAGQPGNFEIRAFLLTVPKTATGTLEVLEYSAKDGSPIHVVRIPVRLPQTSMTVKYFSGQYVDGAALDLDCSNVFEQTATVVRSSLPVETTLRYLLAPKLWEQEGIRVTHIPRDTRLVSLKVSGGTATAVLSPELQNYGGGSCNVEAIRSQIETTLKQFSSVNSVVIIEQGKTAQETLQP